MSSWHLLAITLTIIVIAQNPELDRCEPGLCGGTEGKVSRSEGHGCRRVVSDATPVGCGLRAIQGADYQADRKMR